MDMLRWVQQDGAKSRQGAEKPDLAAARTWREKSCPPAIDAFLNSALDPAITHGDLHGYYIYGKKVYGDNPPAVAALTFQWDFSSPTRHAQVLVVLTTADPAASPSGPFPTAAFRFETGDVGTVHDFDHAQPSQWWRFAQGRLPGTQDPMNVRSPAFPLDSDGPVGVVFNVVRALYGTRYANHMATSDPDVRQGVQAHLQQIPGLQRRRVTTTMATANTPASTTPQPGPVTPAPTAAPPVTPKPAPPPGKRAARRPHP